MTREGREKQGLISRPVAMAGQTAPLSALPGTAKLPSNEMARLPLLAQEMGLIGGTIRSPALGGLEHHGDNTHSYQQCSTPPLRSSSVAPVHSGG